jgi:hypothetical protein
LRGDLQPAPLPPFLVKNTSLFIKEKQNNKKVHVLNELAIFLLKRGGGGPVESLPSIIFLIRDLSKFK